MPKIEKNEQLKRYFERRTKTVSARANGALLGFATGCYVVSAILNYLELHPDQKDKPIKLKKLAKFGCPRPLKVRRSDGMRYYRLLEYAEKSNLLKILARRKFWNGSIGVIVELNPNAILADYEVEWPDAPYKTWSGITIGQSDSFVFYDSDLKPGDSKESFWNDGWTEYDANFIFKGLWSMLYQAAYKRNDQERIKIINEHYKELYPALEMVKQECDFLLQRVKEIRKL